MKTTVIAKFSVPGFHAWHSAPPEVEYLRYMHRHQFVFRVGVYVHHVNREVEFHMLLKQCQENLDRYPRVQGSTVGHQFGSRSCEMLAVEMIEALQEQSYKVAWVEVWEDDECGARVEP